MAMQTQTPQSGPAAGSATQPLTTAQSPEPQVPDWREMRRQARAERRDHYHEAGVPVWGVLLIVVGGIALLGNFGFDLGWLFGLALGTWFVYLGVRRGTAQGGEQINWWLVGLGLLIGLGSVSTGFTDRLVFPFVLILVGVGILGQQYIRRPN